MTITRASLSEQVWTQAKSSSREERGATGMTGKGGGLERFLPLLNGRNVGRNVCASLYANG